MHYTIIRDKVEQSYEVERTPTGRWLVHVGDREVELDVEHLPDGSVHLLIDGKSHNAFVHLDGAKAECALRGESVAMCVYSDRELRLMRLDAASSGGFDPQIKSPMSGKIISVKVSPGQAVKEGDGLVVVEAMKMENLIRAPHDGIVKSVDVELGAAVETGARLLLMAAPAEEDAA